MFTIYNEEESRFQLVEEPNSSLSYTYADYLKWKFEEQVELIRGKIFKMCPAPTPLHQQISGKVFLQIGNFLKKKSCLVFSAPFDVRLPLKNKMQDSEITTVVQPDLCVVCDSSKIDDRGCLGAPDLIVEVLSPGNTEKEVKFKFELYEEAGVKEYWVVYPAEQNIAVFILNEKGKYYGARIYAGKDGIKSSAVKGLVIKLDDIFTK
jgi:Uma2 family endonuclease